MENDKENNFSDTFREGIFKIDENPIKAI